MPDSDLVVSVTGEQVLTVSRPSQRDGFGVLGLGAGGNLRLEFVQQGSFLQLEDLDARGGGSSQPVSVGRESQGADFSVSVQGVQGDVVVQVPQDDDTVLAGRSAQRPIGRQSDARDVTGVADEVSVALVVGQVPRLEC